MSVSAKLRSLLVHRDGVLTRDLRLEKGRFGLGKVLERRVPDATTTMVCGFCSTGCGLNVHLRDGEAISLTPATDYPVNLGAACPKGWEALRVLTSPDRATVPLVRNAAGVLEETSWPAALDAFVTRVKDIQARHGKDSVAFLGSGQLVTEELALLGAVAKLGMGMVHGDGNTRQCMATSVVAYNETFGFDAPPFTYDDFEESDVLVFVGANPCIAHPIMWERVVRNPHAPEIVVLDPRTTETAMVATQHLALRPKSDLSLLYGIAHVLVREGWIDRAFIDAHTTGWDAFAAHVKAYTPAIVAAASGLAEEAIERVARTIHDGKRVSFWWTMGVNQSHEGVRTAQAIIALALMTGNIGRPGTGANSITGQCNAMGSRLYSNTTNLFGGRDFGSANDRADVARILGIPVAAIPDRGSLAYDQILQGVHDGTIRGLWIIGTNSAHSWIEQDGLHDALSKLDLLVVQDMYRSTETAERADIVFPAAGWGEKDGTFINSERRFGVVKRVARAPGQALADFSIFRLVADRYGCGEMFARWSSPESVFQIIKELSAGRPCDITGITDYRMLDAHGGVQWPLRATDDPALAGTARRLFADGAFFHADGRARFITATPRAMPEAPCDAYPLLLLTGRGSAAQWHTQTRTGKSEVLKKLYPAAVYVEVNPADAERLAIRAGDVVEITSRRARIDAMAHVTDAVQEGHVFVPMHYRETNRLTLSAVDPHSRQPAYKACAVRVGARTRERTTPGSSASLDPEL